MYCWAREIGGCSSQQSGEHYASRTLFTAKQVKAGGFAWAGEGEKTIGISTAIVKTLCKIHNERLSPLDSAAGEMRKAILESSRLIRTRAKMSKTKLWNPISYNVDGALFERWAIKFLIGMLFADGQSQQWHIAADKSADTPPLEIVRAVFGSLTLKPPMGLYLTPVPNVVFDSSPDTYGNIVLRHPATSGIRGAQFDFKGYVFVIWLDHNTDGVYETPGGRRFSLSDDGVRYRPNDLPFKIGKNLSHRIRLNW